MKRQNLELFNKLELKLVEKYISTKEPGCFSFVKPSESEKRLALLANDLLDLARRFAGNQDVVCMSSYKLLVRVLDEQCEVTGSEKEEQSTKVSVKPAKEVSSDSLQNPSDPDAAYDGHKGQGYQVQVMETYSCEEDRQKGNKTPNLITHVEVEPANESDANALVPAIESTSERGLKPDQVLADSLYGSDDNFNAAEERGVELVAPTMGRSSKKEIILSDFEFSKDGEVTACPEGHAPSKIKTKGQRHTARFDKKRCGSCPRRDSCPVRPGRKGWYYLRYNDKALRLAMRRASERGPEFKDRYRYRAGVEAAMSEFDRRTGVKQLRVRGMPAVRVSAKLKALGLNIFRAAYALKPVNESKEPPTGEELCLTHASVGAFPVSRCAFSSPRERIWSIYRRIVGFFDPDAIVGTLAFNPSL